MDIDGSHDPQATRIDKRILKHLLHETADLLEESQTHALVEKPTATNAHVLAQANWRMMSTCAWALSELLPIPGEDGQSDRLQAPAPIFSREEGDISDALSTFVSRVDRLHERARKLDLLSRGPTVSSSVPVMPFEAMEAEPRESASVIPLFGSGAHDDEPANPVHHTHRNLNRLMAVRD